MYGRKYEVTPKQDRFLIVASDGLWVVFKAEGGSGLCADSKRLLGTKSNVGGQSCHLEALCRWQRKQTKAVYSVAIVFFEVLDSEPPGPPTPKAKRVKSCGEDRHEYAFAYIKQYTLRVPECVLLDCMHVAGPTF